MLALTVEQMAEMHHSGTSLSDIAKRAGCATSTVARVFHKHNIPIISQRRGSTCVATIAKCKRLFQKGLSRSEIAQELRQTELWVKRQTSPHCPRCKILNDDGELCEECQMETTVGMQLDVEDATILAIGVLGDAIKRKAHRWLASEEAQWYLDVLNIEKTGFSLRGFFNFSQSM